MKKSRKNRFLGVLLSLALVLGLMPGMSLTTWAEGTSKWIECAADDISDGDTVIVTMTTKGGDTYGLANNNGLSAPSAVSLSISNNVLTGSAENLAKCTWTVERNNGILKFRTGSEDYLYCINNNNGVRVGSNANNTLEIDSDSGYLKNISTSRYIGVYSGQDWRCYTSINSNIQNQTLKFWKEDTGEDEPEPLYTFDATSTSDQKDKWEYMISGVDATRITKIEALIDMESLADWGQVVWYDNDDDNKRHSVGIDGTPGIKKYTVEGETIPEADAAIIQIVGKAKLLGYAVYYGDTLAKTEGVLVVTKKLADSKYAQGTVVDNVNYTRFVYVLPYSELDGKNKATFTVTKGAASATFDTSYYYTGVVSSGITYKPANDGSVMLVCTVKGGSPDELTCELKIDGEVYEPNN